jgi:predicted metal-dependent hydrolase
MQANLKTSGGLLPYTITRRARVTRRLHMELDETGGLVVVAPAHWTKTFIAETLVRNRHLVEKFLAASSGRVTKHLQYTAGEKHLYLGLAHRLVTHAAKHSRVAVIEKELHVWAAPQPGKIKLALQNWYDDEARTLFQARLIEVAQRAPWTHGEPILLKQRRMKRTWGNCSKSGLIKLNTHLVKAPVNIIDSVIAHELCHLEEMNHGPLFYTLLEKLNPGWKQDRARLRSQGQIYLRT